MKEISEFIKESKAKMAAGASVVIPSVGQYVMKGHQLHFELDAAFALPTNPLLFPIVETPKVNFDEQKVKDEPSFESYNNYCMKSPCSKSIIFLIPFNVLSIDDFIVYFCRI